MRLKTYLSGLLVCVSINAFADEKPECASAVDAADRVVPAYDQPCDYTKTGLNGILHKAINGAKDTAPVSDAHAVPQPQQTARSATQDEALLPAAQGQFETPVQLQALKFSLLKRLVLECPKGFVVEEERYVVDTSQKMRLELIHHCL